MAIARTFSAKAIGRAAAGDSAPTQNYLWLYLWAAGIVVAFVVVTLVQPLSTTTFSDASAAFLVITSCAVGIERAMEFFWTWIDQAKGSPLTGMADSINAVTASLNKVLTPVYDAAKAEVDKLQTADAAAVAEVNNRKAQIDQFQKTLNALLQSTPDNTQLLPVALLTAKNQIDQLKTLYPTIDAAASAATATIGDVSAFLATFQDNPGRRMIGILAGSVIGLVLAFLLGLDLFKYAAGTAFPLAHLDVALTGLVIGLGSNPTHEVIRAIQEYKTTQKNA